MPPITAEALFDTVNITYQHQYSQNPTLLTYLHRLAALLPPGSKILDLGCGTGHPAATTLLDAGMHLWGIDISQEMITIAQRQAPGGTFVKADMATYDPPHAPYDAVLLLFSHMQLSLHDTHATMRRLAAALRPGGLCLVAAVPADGYVAKGETCAEGLEAPFMGHVVAVTLFTTGGLLALLGEVGFEVLGHEVVRFVPKVEAGEKAEEEEEEEVFVLARLGGGVGEGEGGKA